tara:strand:+ start:46630 stop:47967 length:1338 start_codon:yes stop_codon:yes gene_type:complete
MHKVGPKTYYIDTFGCQMNVSDSEVVESILKNEGCVQASKIEKADIVFVNTCAIRDHAEKKVHSQLGRYAKLKLANKNLIIGVLGCMAQSLKDDLLEKKPYVDIILGPDSYRKLPLYLNRSSKKYLNNVDTKLSRFEVYDNIFPSRAEGINAWVSIMRGCDKFCSFCIVPFTRGRERSRSVESIVCEISQAISDGFKEITLLGQNVNSYNYNGKNFQYLLEEIAGIKGLMRIRYTSPHPQDITEKLLYTMSNYDNICNYIHLPLQSGSDRILKRMNRSYTRDHYINLVKKIKSFLPNAGISTDIIVGFPGETQEDFTQTLDLMSKVKFDSAFMFKYSPRRGTKATEYVDQLDEKEKQSRLEDVIKLQKQHTLEKNKKLVGTEVLVMVEKESKKSPDRWAGRTDSNKWVIFDKHDSKIKDIVKVKITDTKGISLQGNIISKAIGAS